MDSWPKIAEPTYPFKEKLNYPALRTQFDAPYRQTRKKFTGATKTFTLKWDEECSLPEHDFLTLEKFFYDNQGDAFYWTHIGTGTTHIVSFDDDALDFTSLTPGYRYGELSITTIGPVTVTGPTVTTTTTTTTTTA